MTYNQLPCNVDRRLGRRRPVWLLLPVLIAVILPAPSVCQVPTRVLQGNLFPLSLAPCPNEPGLMCPVISPEEIRFRGYVSSVISRWMQERKLPPEDLEGVIKKYGRVDLVADIQAYVAADILTVLEKPDASRTSDEQFVLSKFEGDLHQSQFALYDYAVQDGESFVKDPCHWTPDAEVAAEYGLVYDGSPYCSQGINTLFRFHVPGPKKEYLLAAAYKKVYGGSDKATVALMQDKLAVHLSSLAASVFGGGVAGGITRKNLSKIVPYTNRERYNATPGRAAARLARLARFLSGGAFTIVTLMAEIGIEAIIAFDEEIKFQQDMDNLRATRNSLAAARQDTVTAVTADLGMEKAMLVIDQYGFGSSGEVLPTHRPGVDRVFIINGDARGSGRMDVKDHDGQLWKVEMWRNWFVRRTADVESITTDLEVTDHDGIQWIAARVGEDRFRMTQINAPEEAPVCPATTTGISSTKGKNCSVYFTDSLPIQLSNGVKAIITTGVAPRIESSSFYFPSNKLTSNVVKVTGVPVPVVTTAGPLPSWLRLSPDGTLSGNPGPGAGKTGIALRVQTASGNEQKPITIFYGDPVQFVSPAVVDIVAEVPVNFTIAVAGTPTASITKTGWLPGFLSFVSNGNGTATLRGRWDGFSQSLCSGSFVNGVFQNPCGLPTIRASNQAQTVDQTLTFRYQQAPRAVYDGPPELKFIAGTEARYLLTAGSPSTRVEWLTASAPLKDQLRQRLPWLRFSDLQGATAEVIGTPPMTGETISHVFTVCPHALGSGFQVCTADNLKISIDGTPRFASSPFGVVQTGKPIVIPVFVNRLNGNIDFSLRHVFTNRIPNGLRIEPAPPQRDGKVTASIVGQVEPGQGGRYEFMLAWTDALNWVDSLFKLDVLEPARITSPPAFTFFEGTSAAGEVTTSGYPINSAGVDCGSPNDCTDMSIRLEWPRPIEGLTLTDRSKQDLATGVGRFGGVIPTGSAGIYDATLVASNSKAASFWQPVKLVVFPTADLNNDGTVDCSDLAAIKNAIGTLQPGPGRGFDLTGDWAVDDKDIAAMVRAVPNLFTCSI